MDRPRHCAASAAIMWSSTIDTSASTPSPCAISVSLAITSHSSGTPGSSGSTASGVVGDVAHRELEQQHVVVRAFQLRRNGQHDVGVLGRLVQVHVDADHELEVRERVGELVRVRCRQHRIAADGDERANLTRTRGEDLLGENGRPGTPPRPPGGRSPASARDRSGSRDRSPAHRACSDRRRRASGTSIHPVGRGCRSTR